MVIVKGYSKYIENSEWEIYCIQIGQEKNNATR